MEAGYSWASVRPGDFLEATLIAGCYRVPSFQGTGPDQQIVERDTHAFGRGFPADFADEFGGIVRDRVDRHGGFQLIKECPAAVPPFHGIRPVDPMHQFGDGDGTERDFPLADLLDDMFEELGDVELLPFRLDDDTGIEDYSQDGGFHGWLRLAMPSSTSCMKPSSSVTVEPRASAKAMHSDSNLPLGRGEWMTATG